MTNGSICFYDLSENVPHNYVVIVARYRGKWVWLRQRNLGSWEVPAGHIDKDETPEMAAHRELWEETGALEYSLIPVCDFSISKNGVLSYNRLFFSDIHKLESLPKFEIEEITFRKSFPKILTHGDIQPMLIEKVISDLGLEP